MPDGRQLPSLHLVIGWLLQNPPPGSLEILAFASASDG
jgi:hypothetical protein